MQPERPPDADLAERMLAAAHAAFALSAASEGIEVGEDDRALVNAAVAAGVVGALFVMREDEAAGR